MRTACAALLLSLALPALATEPPVYGPELEGFDYPHPVKRFAFDSQGEKLQMAYMDIQPSTPNGHTLVLLHGKNFCGATWEGSIQALTQAGYRVVVPDQVGFCKSSKPQRYQFSFQQLAANTHALLASLKLEKVTLMGHSMGGMLASRYALQYPQQVEQLVLVNPIGLEDWKAKGVPWRSIDAWYQRELKTSSETIRNYQKSTYYAGQWRPEFDKWVEMQAGMYRGKGREAVAWDSALTYDMIYTQPVVHEFDKLQMPVLLLIGQTDNTAPGKDAAPEALRGQLGNYKVLGQQAAERIPDARLVTFADLGHSPQIQAPEVFHKALLEGLKAR
ncbi:alpha/beta hydrolase [Pseudomonas sp. zfem005]|uniref:alpha/beta fold hydrolase n=1 Tax=Pseudomonas sp. zfem005 TaxID=3078200 RepID=UPI002927EC15|nr:alpha/beta hydrolase [Pseudomonas sp. zfem005]MDU9415980.1 alpha/beta hydrolase [Pseudomonas sp. zfem005]